MNETAADETSRPLDGEADVAWAVRRAVDAAGPLPQAREALVLMVLARLRTVPEPPAVDSLLADLAESNPELFAGPASVRSRDRDWLRIGSSLRNRLDARWRRLVAAAPRPPRPGDWRVLLPAGLILAVGTAAVAFVAVGQTGPRVGVDDSMVTSTITTPQPSRAYRNAPDMAAGVAPGFDSSTQSGIPVGVPDVLDTTTLRVGKAIVRLDGVDWARGGNADEFRDYIAGRSVTCTPIAGRETFTCSVDGRDLATAVAYNGGAVAKPDAADHIKAAEARARAAAVGVWKRAVP